MQEDIDLYFEMADDSMSNAVSRLHKELSKLRAGKASPAVLDGLFVNYYGSQTPLTQVANVGTADSRTLTIQPWEKKMLAPIERAIFEANLGFTPQNDGQLIRINIPPLTEERRRSLVKRAKALGEDAKVSVRNARRDAKDGIKSSVKEGYPEDEGKKRETELQEQTNAFGSKIDKLVAAKERDIMKI